MKSFCTCQTRFSQFTLSFLGLAFCVFLWGLQYKLSLYDPPQSISHKIPTAKLLSKDEQGASRETALMAKIGVSEKEVLLPLVCVAIPVLAAVNLLYRPVLVRWHTDARQRWRPRRDACLSAFSFRAPPIPA